MNADRPLPTIAVVIPNRNDEPYLSACLNSVLGQNASPDEIVFVDDQSSDSSLATARSILADVHGANVVANPVRLGTMGALNEGLRRVSSDYVLFLASNDHLVDGMLERVRYSIAAHGTPGVWSAMVWTADIDGRCRHIYPSPVVGLGERRLSPAECISLAKKLGNWFTGTTLVFHRETLQSIGGFDVAFAGLGDLFAALTVSSLRGAVFCPQPYGVMRSHPDGFLWRTLTDRDNLEAILDRVAANGPTLSPALYTPNFCQRTRHRIRFAALRASAAMGPQRCDARWRGFRYRLLDRVQVLLGRRRRLTTIAAFIVLRPFDLLPTLWYRVVGFAWLHGLGRSAEIRPPQVPGGTGESIGKHRETN